MGGAEALQRLLLSGSDVLYQASADIKNGFYQCEIPEWLCSYFTFQDRLSPDELVEVFGPSGGSSSGASGGGEFPVLRVLPIGVQLAVFLCAEVSRAAPFARGSRARGLSRRSLAGTFGGLPCRAVTT